jgi:hypothetical protein
VEVGTLTVELDREPFAPARLHLNDGSCVDLPTPFLTFIHQGKRLFAARAIRVAHNSSADPGLELIPLADIVRVDRLAAGR